MKTWLAALLAAVSVAPAYAGLLGQSIDITTDILGTRATDRVLVRAGAEIECPSGPYNICGGVFLTARNQFIDAADTSITYSYDGTDGDASFTNVSTGFNGF